MNCVLVTGGAGFIGSCLVRQLIQDGVQVVNLDRLTYAGHTHNLADIRNDAQHVFVQGEIGDRALVRELLDKHQPRAVVNLAAESHVDRSIARPTPFLHTNVVGTFSLLETVYDYWRDRAASREDFRFLQVSTDEVFGAATATDDPRGEDSAYRPTSPYSASKAAADHFVRAFGHTYGLPMLVTHCSNNYGPYQFPEKLIPVMVLSALEGKPLPVYGDGRQIRDWLFVEDHCRALRMVLERGQVGETYNIGGNCEVPNIDLVRDICRIVDCLRPELPHTPCEQLIQHVADRPGHDFRYALDISKIREELGWRPRQEFQAGLRLTVEWYLDHPSWVQQVVANAALSSDGEVSR